MAKAKKVRKKGVKKQTKKECSNATQKFDGKLPPILPEFEWWDNISSGIGSEAKRRFELTFRAYSAAVYAHQDHFAPRTETLLSEPTRKLLKREKEQLLKAFDTECHIVMNSLMGLIETQKPISSGKRLTLFEDYQEWINQLKVLLREALFAEELESQKIEIERLLKSY